MEQLSEILGGLILVTGAVLMVYFIARYTYLIKKMLIEKGVFERRSEAQITKVDVAYVMVGVGVGLLLAALLSLLQLPETTMDLLAWGAVLLSGAAGLLFAARKKQS